MTSPELENLVRSGHLSLEGRFDLAYNAAHALALAALRHRGYRSDNRTGDPEINRHKKRYNRGRRQAISFAAPRGRR